MADLTPNQLVALDEWLRNEAPPGTEVRSYEVKDAAYPDGYISIAIPCEICKAKFRVGPQHCTTDCVDWWPDSDLPLGGYWALPRST